MEKIIILALCFLPVLIEAYLDRKGEDRKGKKKDTLWLIIIVASLVGLAWWLFDINPLLPALLVLMFRITCFDYIVTWFLKRNDVISPTANVWSYTGKSTFFWDQWMVKIPWRLRLVLRVVLLIASVAFYIA